MPQFEQRTADADNPCLRQNWQPSCFASYMGPWMIEADWFSRAVAAIKSGVFVVVRPPKAEDAGPGGVAERPAYHRTSDGIAVISAEGPLQKASSKFGGTSTVAMRRAIRQAVGDAAVRAIMLLVDSPGGTVSGTAELAADIATAARSKPVHAHVEDLAGSAAYWLASQAHRVTATATSQVGGIGTYCVVEDSSGQMAKEGIVVHVIAAGKFKGLGEWGRPITADELAYVQSRIDALNEHFLAGVAAGRRMSMDAVRAVADGRIYIGAEAGRLGLIDAVENQDQAMAAVREAARTAQGVSHMWNPVKAIIQALAGTTDASAIDASAGVAAAAVPPSPPPAVPEPATADTSKVEPPKADEAKSTAVDGAVQAAAATDAGPAAPAAASPPPPPAPPARPPDARAELKTFIEAFGEVKGARWFSEDRTFAQAQGLFAADLREERDRLLAENAELKGRPKVDRGSPGPVSFAVPGGGSPKAGLAEKLGDNMAAFAASLKYAPEGKNQNQ